MFYTIFYCVGIVLSMVLRARCDARMYDAPYEMYYAQYNVYYIKSMYIETAIEFK